MNNTKIQETFKSTTEILDAAEELVSNAPNDLKDAIKPYFVSRYFVALFEARHGEIPIQVWNEYRNAFDHLFRSLVNQDPTQIKDVKKHLLRAALDILKLHIHKTSDVIKKEIDSHEPEVLRLVDNGVFFEDIKSSHKRYVKDFEIAKTRDLSLGNNHEKNGAVLEKYLNAAFSFENLAEKMVSKEKEIRIAQQTYDSIHDKAHKHSKWDMLQAHFVVHIIYVAIVAVLLLITTTALGLLPEHISVKIIHFLSLLHIQIPSH